MAGTPETFNQNRSAAAHELDQLDPVALGQGGVRVERPGHDGQVSLHGDLANVESELLDEGQNRPRGHFARISVDLNAHVVTSTRSDPARPRL